uniref:Tail terminator n=1 Tax=Micrococcus phage Kurnik TaxID=3092208 RepID=A0AAU6R665_9CAUD
MPELLPADIVRDLRFNLEGLDPKDPIVNLKFTTNLRLQSAIESFEEEAAKIATGLVTSGILESLMYARASYEVHVTLAHLLRDDDITVEAIRNYAVNEGFTPFVPNSTSNVSVEMRLVHNAAWARIAYDLRFVK